MRIAPHSSTLFFPLLLFSCSGDRWDLNSCPTNLSAYVGCSLRVDALFESFNRKCSDGHEYSFSIQINNKIELPEEDVHSVGINGNDSVCNVSGVITDPKVEYQSVAFYAKRASQTTAPIRIHCEDSILVKDGIDSPSFLKPSKRCDGIFFKWTGPDLLPGYEVQEYFLHIFGTNITNETTNTSILISYEDLEYNQEYNISLSASYCAGLGNKTFKTFFTAIAPQIESTVSPIVHVQNTTHAAISLTTKVVDADCIVSYPTIVEIEITCKGEKVFLDTRPVSVGNDGSITIDFELPVDSGVCQGMLTWKNQYFAIATHTDTQFNTNQLQECEFWVEKDEIIVVCKYVEGSMLRGCRGVAVHQSTNRNYTNNYITHTCGGDITDVCAGVYNVTCYGLISPTSIIGYSGSQYSKVLSASSGSNCDSSTISSLMVSCTTTLVTPTCMIAPLSDSKINTILALGIVVGILSILLLISWIALVVIQCKRRSKRVKEGTETISLISRRSSGHKRNNSFASSGDDDDDDDGIGSDPEVPPSKIEEEETNSGTENENGSPVSLAQLESAGAQNPVQKSSVSLENATDPVTTFTELPDINDEVDNNYVYETEAEAEGQDQEKMKFTNSRLKPQSPNESPVHEGADVCDNETEPKLTPDLNKTVPLQPDTDITNGKDKFDNTEQHGLKGIGNNELSKGSDSSCHSGEIEQNKSDFGKEQTKAPEAVRHSEMISKKHTHLDAAPPQKHYPLLSDSTQEQENCHNLAVKSASHSDCSKENRSEDSSNHSENMEQKELTQPPLSDLNQPSIPSPALQTPLTDLASVPASDENKTGSMKEQTDDQSQATPTPQDLASKHDAGGINPESSQDKQTNSTDDKESLPKSESLHSVHQPLQVQQQKSNEDKKYVY